MDNMAGQSGRKTIHDGGVHHIFGAITGIPICFLAVACHNTSKHVLLESYKPIPGSTCSALFLCSSAECSFRTLRWSDFTYIQ
jgi:hypothetical protein